MNTQAGLVILVWKTVPIFSAPKCHQAVPHLDSICDDLAIWGLHLQTDVKELDEMLPKCILQRKQV